MTDSSKPVSIKILDKEYLISCPEDERDQLFNAVTYLNTQMQNLKNNGSVIGTERIAVMAALNLANELLAYKRENDDYATSVDSMVKRLQTKIDDALVKGRQLEM